MHHETFVAEVLRNRGSARPAEPKPAWQRFLESTGGAAFITVLLGGVFGQWITSSLQSQLRQREQSLAAYNEFLKQEHALVQQTYELIGNSMVAAEDLVIMTRPEFALDRFPGDDRKIVAQQKVELRDRFNKYDAQWRSDRVKLGLLMSYYYQGQQEVVSAWRSVQDGVSAYMDCSREWYLRKLGEPPSSAAISDECQSEQKKLREQLDVLTASMDMGRRRTR